jgi:exonuclease III
MSLIDINPTEVGDMPSLDLRVVSINVNGCNDREKRLILFDWCRTLRADVVLLIDSKIKDLRLADGFRYGWNPKPNSRLIPPESAERRSWWTVTEDESHSGGCAILVRPEAPFMVASVTSTSDGRALRVTGKWAGEMVALEAIYAPAKSKARKRWFKEVWTELPNIATECASTTSWPTMQIVGGDFNCCVGPDDFAGASKPKKGKTSGSGYGPIKGAVELGERTARRGISDVWLDSNLEDVDENKGYTFYQKRDGAPPYAARLDRVYACSTLRQDVEEIFVANFPHSDHHAVVVQFGLLGRSIAGNAKQPKTNYIMNDAVLQSTVGRAAMVAAIGSLGNAPGVHSTTMDWWLEMKTVCTKTLRQLSKALAAKRKKEHTQLSERLEQLAGKTLNEEEFAEQKKVESDLCGINEYKLRGLAVRARVSQAERNETSKVYLTARLKKREYATSLKALTLKDGSVSTDPKVINSALLAFWADVFTEPVEPDGRKPKKWTARDMLGCVSQITAGARTSLENDISVEEVTEVLATMRSGASPGIDGIPASFYKLHWKHLKEPFSLLLKEAEVTGGFGKEFVRARIVLLPKTKSKTPTAGCFRPIALLGSDYKLVAKVLNRRLRKVLPQVIPAEQCGFVDARSICTGVVTMRDYVHFAKAQCTGDKRKSPKIIQCDFKKAFDMVRSSYLQDCMKAIGIGDRFRRWIATCYAFSSASLDLGKTHIGEVRPTRGVRQGDPLSPSLFIISLNPLLALMKTKQVVKGARLPKLPNSLRNQKCLIGCFFADDISLFPRNERDALEMLICIYDYGLASGAMLHMGKTKVFCISGGNYTLGELFAGLAYLTAATALKSLGVLYGPEVTNTTRWNGVIAKMEERTQVLRSRQLSLRGRVIAANVYVQSLSSYIAMFVPATPEVVEKLDRCVKELVWSTAIHKKHRGRVSIDRLQLPWKYGGLGLRLPSVVIKTTLMKLAARAIAARGEVWTVFAEYEMRSWHKGTRDRWDGALSDGAIPSSSTSPWAAAFRALRTTGMERVPKGVNHDLHVNTPLWDNLSEISITPPGVSSKSRKILIYLNITYFGDCWNEQIQDFVDEEVIGDIGVDNGYSRRDAKFAFEQLCAWIEHVWKKELVILRNGNPVRAKAGEFWRCRAKQVSFRALPQPAEGLPCTCVDPNIPGDPRHKSKPRHYRGRKVIRGETGFVSLIILKDEPREDFCSLTCQQLLLSADGRSLHGARADQWVNTADWRSVRADIDFNPLTATAKELHLWRVMLPLHSLSKSKVLERVPKSMNLWFNWLQLPASTGLPSNADRILWATARMVGAPGSATSTAWKLLHRVLLPRCGFSIGERGIVCPRCNQTGWEEHIIMECAQVQWAWEKMASVSHALLDTYDTSTLKSELKHSIGSKMWKLGIWNSKINGFQRHIYGVLWLITIHTIWRFYCDKVHGDSKWTQAMAEHAWTDGVALLARQRARTLAGKLRRKPGWWSGVDALLDEEGWWRTGKYLAKTNAFYSH